MDSDTLISIIIPVYNVLPYLCEALDSVIHQSYPHLEILVIDDGSTDGSGDICDIYAEKDHRIHVIHQKNKGLSAARNTGLNHITGGVVAFLDPDDAYDIRYIEKMISAMILEQADLVVCKFTKHYTKKRMEQKKNNQVYPVIAPGTYGRTEMLCKLLDESANVNVWNKLYKSELWAEIRFRCGHVSEDHEIAFQILDKCRTIVVSGEPLYLHRKRPGSITATLTWNNLSDRLLAYSNTESVIRSNLSGILPESMIRKAAQARLNVQISAYARLFLVKGKMDKKAEGKKLRQQILEAAGKTGLGGCRIKTRAAYCIICLCPWFLKLFGCVYFPLKQLIRKIIRQ